MDLYCTNDQSFCHFILFNLYLSKKAEENYINFVKSQEEKNFFIIISKNKRTFEDLNIIRHDLKNQLLALKSQPGESNQYTQHIDSLLNDLSKSSSAIHTGNPFIDVLISEKLKLIHEQHISCK